jgi:hypothetical protein
MPVLLVFFSAMQRSWNIVLLVTVVALKPRRKAMQRTRFQTFKYRLCSRRRLIGELLLTGNELLCFGNSPIS